MPLPRLLALAGSSLALAALFPLASPAQELATQASSSPTAPAITLPQYASITSTTNAVQISRLPVNYGGKAYYIDVTLDLTANVESSGTVLLDVASSSSASPLLTTNNFKAGTYVGPSNVNGGKDIIVVSGPSALPGGGTGWSLSVASGGSTGTNPYTATWYDEPISANPLAPRINNDKITSNQLVYGVGDGGNSYNCTWSNNNLLGFSQVGNTLVISDFSSACGGGEGPTPVDTITYTLVPPSSTTTPAQ
jgi:hypothetical protein